MVNSMVEEQADLRLMAAIDKVGSKVDDLAKSTGEAQIQTAVAIAKIQQIELTCPIQSVEERLREVEKHTSVVMRDSKRMSAIISAIIGGIWAAILAFVGWHRTGG